MPEAEHDFMRGGRRLAKQRRQCVRDVHRGAEDQLPREVASEVLKVMPIAANGVLSLALEPRAKDRFRGVLTAGGDGERRGQRPRLPIANEKGGVHGACSFCTSV